MHFFYFYRVCITICSIQSLPFITMSSFAICIRHNVFPTQGKQWHVVGWIVSVLSSLSPRFSINTTKLFCTFCLFANFKYMRVVLGLCPIAVSMKLDRILGMYQHVKCVRILESIHKVRREVTNKRMVRTITSYSVWPRPDIISCDMNLLVI